MCEKVTVVDVTVVVATRNRPELLECVLGCLLDQDYRGEREIVVVDDGSTVAAEVPDWVRLIRHGRPKGLKACWNSGFDAATAGLVVFLTDGDAPPKGWLRAFVDGAAANPDASVFRGPTG